MTRTREPTMTEMENICLEITTTMITTMTTQRRWGAWYKFLLLFSIFDHCFIWFVLVDYFSNCEFPFEPRWFGMKQKTNNQGVWAIDRFGPTVHLWVVEYMLRFHAKVPGWFLESSWGMISCYIPNTAWKWTVSSFDFFSLVLCSSFWITSLRSN